MLIAFERGRSLFHRTSPLSKLFMLACVTVYILHTEQLVPQAGLFVGLLLLCRWGANISWTRLRKAVMFVLSFGLPYFVLTSLAIPLSEGDTLWARFGPISISSQGTMLAGALTIRMFNLFISSLLFIATTDPRDFVQSLTMRLKVPYRFAFGVSIALTFLPLLEEEGRLIAQAHKVRGMKPQKGLRSKVRWFQKYIISILSNSIRRVQQTAGAMEAKGFGAYPERTYTRVTVYPVSGLWLSIGCLLLLILGLFI
ncbi:energy-coupling factor transporter transmembrane component T [Paenibacillus sp. Marseille-Q4541]|uniref:energy-coupling factor transporter transmembrane component T family protein n=1 Tax=Paenibacillus sp. Marseille-Q4541 TaxID=2831522 RepID=UPI001BA867A0|nr:energy-coupling factor transporter transmembrane component T [Paenibacillus sp. Marseille-Q4541]